ncbi:hypothetical protein NMYAN_340004 [Nitrosomonas nitrosa]|uniref:Uncharacterized protein n=1 Tax=Nitrosomonas nitrosa TaxID=52442 RepID=A0A8H8Z0L5_9PROT|nr:hypothetical protein NMYAN_340004 [Nitrosomonas nitrosa]
MTFKAGKRRNMLTVKEALGFPAFKALYHT